MTERRALFFASIGHYLNHLMMLLYATVVLALEDEFGQPYGALLSLSLPGFVLYGAGALPAGWLADRWGAKRMMMLFFFGTGAAGIGTGMMGGPVGIAVGLGLVGLCASIYHPVAFAWLVRHAERRGRALGFVSVFGSLGMASAAIVAGTLIDLAGWRAAFIVPGVASILVGAVFAVMVPQDAPEPAAPSEAAADGRTTGGLVRLFVTLAAFIIGASVVYNAMSMGLPKLFAVRLGAAGGLLGISGWVTGVFVIAAACQILGGYMADRYPHRRVLVAAYAIQIPLLLFAAGAAGLPIFLAAALILSLTLGIQPAVDSMVAHHSPPQWRSTAYGFRFVVSLTASSASVPLVGLIFDATGGFAVVFGVLAAIAASVVVAGLALPGAHRPRARAAAE